MQVAIVTHTYDNGTVEMVTEALEFRGADVFRLNTDQYPTSVPLYGHWGTGVASEQILSIDGVDVDFHAMDAIWYRRYRGGRQLPQSLGQYRSAALKETDLTLYGAIAASRAFQLDPVSSVRRCDHKELQTRVAIDSGLLVPPILFTNSAEAARAFIVSADGPVIAKMQSHFAIHQGDQEQVVFTTEVDPQNLDSLERLKYCPMIFQHRVAKRFDIRSIVVGKQVFSARFDPKTIPNTDLDWRMSGVETIEYWEAFELPAAESDALLRLTASMGLNYAAADFVMDTEGNYQFLEINASGEWFWLEESCGLQISDAIAGVLLGELPRV
ncbi:MAG: MvdD family ATP-grasp ribosomal peptide maturase [Gammaproteobacteria bacterium]|nr:MvdD family ATP-grasp ribosomal peptide maturase [Gammaproteobacteria bacterium]